MNEDKGLLRELAACRTDPMRLKAEFWPGVVFYEEQKAFIESVVTNTETYVVSANKMGKDFGIGFVIPWFFLTRDPCKIVLTSVTEKHLNVLFGEVNRFVNTCKYPLLRKNGGPLDCKYHSINKYWTETTEWGKKGQRCDTTYVLGMVANIDSLDALQGHHASHRTLEAANSGIPLTLWVGDEGSGLRREYFEKTFTWSHRRAVIGNSWACENQFKYAFEGTPDRKHKGGDIPNLRGGGMYRKTFRLSADRSPNVRAGLAQQRRGQVPDGRVLLQGVKTWDEYATDLANQNDAVNSVTLHAKWFDGSGVKMFPSLWLDRAERRAQILAEKGRRNLPKSIGVDPAEGGDNTAIAAVDALGLVDLEYAKTPDTSKIRLSVMKMMHKYDVPAERVCFDHGGGGKQIVDEMRADGFEEVRTVGFGDSVTPEVDVWNAKVMGDEKLENKEQRQVYKNRRAQMYGALRTLLDPGEGTPAKVDGKGVEVEEYRPDLTSPRETFAIPSRFFELRQELEPIPLIYERGAKEGVMVLLPKHRKSDSSTELCLVDLIGHSPDLADATVLAIYAMQTAEDEEDSFVCGQWNNLK